MCDFACKEAKDMYYAELASGVKHFKETPIWGVGFAVSYNALGEKKIGRMESGSGWLSILFQTGLLGFSVMLLILCGLRKVMIYIWKDYELLLYLFAFVYLCLHSLFEGYILAVLPCRGRLTAR